MVRIRPIADMRLVGDTEMAKADLNAPERGIAWRRCDAWEAAGYFFAVFTLCNVLRVAWDSMAEDTIDYEKAFTQSLIFGLAWAGMSMVLKIKPVVLRQRA